MAVRMRLQVRLSRVIWGVWWLLVGGWMDQWIDVNGPHEVLLLKFCTRVD